MGHKPHIWTFEIWCATCWEAITASHSDGQKRKKQIIKTKLIKLNIIYLCMHRCMWMMQANMSSCDVSEEGRETDKERVKMTRLRKRANPRQDPFLCWWPTQLVCVRVFGFFPRFDLDDACDLAGVMAATACVRLCWIGAHSVGVLVLHAALKKNIRATYAAR